MATNQHDPFSFGQVRLSKEPASGAVEDLLFSQPSGNSADAARDTSWDPPPQFADDIAPAQAKAPPTHTALILSLESVFGMASGIAFLGERPDLQKYAGAALMLGGVVISQVIQPASVADADKAMADDPQPR
jgi:hypothetical protein